MKLNYFQRKTVYYTTLLSELQDMDYLETFNLVAPIFATRTPTSSQEACGCLKDLILNPTFQRLNSTQAIDMHVNFVQSFCHDIEEYGMKEDELEALKIRYEAISLIEELSKDVVSDPVTALLRLQKEKGCCTVIIVLLLYARGNYDNKSAAMLGKALKGGDLDSGIIALHFANEVRSGQLCSEMLNMQEVKLHPEIKEILSPHCSGKDISLSDGLSQTNKTSGGV